MMCGTGINVCTHINKIVCKELGKSISKPVKCVRYIFILSWLDWPYWTRGQKARSGNRIALFGRNLTPIGRGQKNGQHGQRGQHGQQPLSTSRAYSQRGTLAPFSAVVCELFSAASFLRRYISPLVSNIRCLKRTFAPVVRLTFFSFKSYIAVYFAVSV